MSSVKKFHQKVNKVSVRLKSGFYVSGVLLALGLFYSSGFCLTDTCSKVEKVEKDSFQALAERTQNQSDYLSFVTSYQAPLIDSLESQVILGSHFNISLMPVIKHLKDHYTHCVSGVSPPLDLVYL